MRIIIDNGHGIDTKGKRSPDGQLREYLWNREVAQMVMDELLVRGLDAALLVPETNDIPLTTRVRRINKVCSEVGASNVILLSIHVNACGNGTEWMKAQGWSAYTCKGRTKSDDIAECLYDAAEHEFSDRKIRKDMQDGDRDWEEDFYIIKKSSCPAVLTENFFMDNKEDAAFLLSAEGKKRCAMVHIEGILAYLEKNYDK